MTLTMNRPPIEVLGFDWWFLAEPLTDEAPAVKEADVDLNKELLKGSVDIIILSLLWSEDLYGYELGKRVRTMTDNRFEMKEGTLYLAFKRLEQLALVESYWGDENAGGRRKYYRLLKAGREELVTKKAEWDHLKVIMEVFLKGVRE